MSNLRDQTLANQNFRQVLLITNNRSLEVTLQNLQPFETIETEVHTVDQFFYLEAGSMYVNGQQLLSGHATVVVAGQPHTVTAGAQGAKFFTIYTPADHKYQDSKFKQ